MDLIKKSKLIPDETSKKNSTKVVIITSIDDDQVNNPILSCLNSANFQTIMWDLNEKNLSDFQRMNNQESEINQTKNANVKKRKADLTCVVCGAEAICYNFGQITCESCKAFFRRNALQPMEKTKCLVAKDDRYEIRCDVQHEIKRKCQRCRLLKCFQSGMRKDYILTPEQKQVKKQRLEENRLLRSIIPEQEQTDTIPKSPTNEHPISDVPSMSLSPSDWLCLTKMQSAYSTASQSVPSAASVVSIELAPDIMSAFMNTLDIQNFAALKLITFLKEIPEFEQLDEHDRLILVKYNLTPLMVIRELFTFDSTREICYDLDSMDNISPTDEAFAQHCKSLYILCYGYDFNRTILSVLNALEKLVNKNPIPIQLLMLIVIFSKGLSADENQEPILNDERSVFKAQSKYLELLFRYLMENSSYEGVVMKIMRIIEQLFIIQKFLRDFQQQIKTKIDVTSINPLMKSLLHFT